MLASPSSAFHLYHITAPALNIIAGPTAIFQEWPMMGGQKSRDLIIHDRPVFEKHGTRLQPFVCHGTLGITEKPSEESATRPREAAISLLLQPFETIRSNRMSGIILLWAHIKGPRQTQNNTLQNKRFSPVIPFFKHIWKKEKYIGHQNVYIIPFACNS